MMTGLKEMVVETHKLLFLWSKGKKYEDFPHHIVTRVQRETLNFMEELKESGVSVNEVDEKNMHLLLSARQTGNGWERSESVIHGSSDRILFYDTLCDKNP